ncbi:NmrA family NAD(P)-binding protein [Edaphobacter dinghuensis]|uniref:Nucleotide-diphosphate-sugar epimerase n=1 Tax=Edaphobacter dinghuensis TaxID=1560005 RepID=A0A917LZ40_9BACT|nr:NAD(P)H-binding protein [Edaphobacter dinghuensis]GGG65190.1 nucleotide-diphosphate-sugar epimerase [Edaphobacter dinghuensis]
MYLVIGATGNVGSQVVEQLLASGRKVRVFTRDASKVAHWGNRVEVAVGDLTSPETFAKAASGVEGIFLMNGALDGEVFRQLIASAKAEGNPRVVFLSTLFAGFENSPIGRLHKDKEDVIRASGLSGRFIRAGAFMTNAFQWIGSVCAEGVVYNATGAGKVAPVAPEDLAAVAVHALTDASLTSEVFEVTGGELLTVPEQVEILAKATGKPIRSVDVPTEAAVQGMIDAGTPAPVAAAVGQSFELVREGKTAVVKDTIRQVTGRPPKTFQSWAKEHAARFA